MMCVSKQQYCAWLIYTYIYITIVYLKIILSRNEAVGLTVWPMKPNKRGNEMKVDFGRS